MGAIRMGARISWALILHANTQPQTHNRTMVTTRTRTYEPPRARVEPTLVSSKPIARPPLSGTTWCETYYTNCATEEPCCLWAERCMCLDTTRREAAFRDCESLLEHRTEQGDNARWLVWSMLAGPRNISVADWLDLDYETQHELLVERMHLNLRQTSQP